MQDLREYSDQELSMVVQNDETLYNAFEEAEDFETFFNEYVKDSFLFTEEQKDYLESDFEVPEIVGHKETLQEIENEGALRGNVAEWILEMLDGGYDEVKSVLNDLMQGGCASGIVSHLIYYTDTVKFHDEHESEIWDLAYESAESLGHYNVMQMFANFNGANNVGSMKQFKNLLSWYAFEETAKNIVTQDLQIEW